MTKRTALLSASSLLLLSAIAFHPNAANAQIPNFENFVIAGDDVCQDEFCEEQGSSYTGENTFFFEESFSIPDARGAVSDGGDDAFDGFGLVQAENDFWTVSACVFDCNVTASSVTLNRQTEAFADKNLYRFFDTYTNTSDQSVSFQAMFGGAFGAGEDTEFLFNDNRFVGFISKNENPFDQSQYVIAFEDVDSSISESPTVAYIFGNNGFAQRSIFTETFQEQVQVDPNCTFDCSTTFASTGELFSYINLSLAPGESKSLLFFAALNFEQFLDDAIGDAFFTAEELANNPFVDGLSAEQLATMVNFTLADEVDDVRDQVETALESYLDSCGFNNFAPQENCDEDFSNFVEDVIDSSFNGNQQQVLLSINNTTAPSVYENSLQSVGAGFGTLGNRIDARTGTDVSLRNQNGNIQLADADSGATLAAGAGVTGWSAFASAGYDFGEKSLAGNSVGYDFHGTNFSAGADHLNSNGFLYGFGVGYSQYKTDLDTNLGNTDVDNISFYGYAAAPLGAFKLDGTLVYGMVDIDTLRNVLGFSLKGNTDANQYGAQARVSLPLTQGGFDVTPSVSARFVRTEIDGYTETGGAPALVIGDQDEDAIQTRAALNISKGMSSPWGTVRPYAEVALENSLGDGNRTVSASFASVPGSGFVTPINNGDKTQFTVGGGADLQLSSGMSLGLDYERVAQNSEIDRQSFKARLRLPF